MSKDKEHDEKKDDKKEKEKEKPKHVPVTALVAVFGFRMLVGFLRHRSAIGVLLLAVVAGAGYALWQFVAPHLLAHPGYLLDPAKIEITAKPDWIRSDVKAEVLRDASLDGLLSVLDPELLKRIADAFALHPWVARVDEVRKGSPAWVKVRIAYRKPVCMVEVPGGLYAIDIEAVLLPSNDFSPADTRRYPRLGGIQTVTEGPMGTRWRDERVVGAAQLAALLCDVWTELPLVRIVPRVEHGRPLSTTEPEYELHTRLGSRIIWGRSPRASAASSSTGSLEPTGDDKLARLRTFAAERGGLDAAGPFEIDLRRAGPVQVGPLTAALPAFSDDAEMRR